MASIKDMTENTEHKETLSQDVLSQELDGQDRFRAKERLTKSILHDEDGENLDLQHWRDLATALRVDGTWFKKQFSVLLLILVALVVYVTNNYQAQQEILEEERLNEVVKDCKYRCLTRESELTRRTRQSELERQLKERGDSTLMSSTEPPFLLTNE